MDAVIKFQSGDLMLLRYGLGTQIARVREVTARGNYKIDRFYPVKGLPYGGVWETVKNPIHPSDCRILGSVPENDRRMPGIRQFDRDHRDVYEV